jgi:hypothetical protein
MIGLFLALGGCSSPAVFERLPESLGGLPAGAPEHPATPYQFPAVHDLPPPRSDQPMSDEDVLNAENALKSARDRQQRFKKPVNDDDGAGTDKKRATNTGDGTNP